MGLFDILKTMSSGVTKQLNPAYANNMDFLEAAVAASALVAAADGSIDQGEREEAIALLTSHKTLGALYGSSKIRDTAAAMFDRANSQSGKASLARELTDIKGKPGGTQMAEDVYFIACDVAASGGVSEAETATLTRIANTLGVNPEPAW
jgi:tellurite resistance protein TerB